MDPGNNGSKIKKIAFNSNSLRNKIAEIRQIAKTRNLEIILLTETKLQEKHKIRIKCYIYIYKNKTSRGGGVAMFMKENIKYRDMNLPNQIKSEVIAIKLLESNTVIVSIYRPPTAQTRK